MRRHYVTKHKGMHVADLYTAGDTCPICMTKFCTRHRVVAHLKGADKCLALARAYTEGYGRQQELAEGVDHAFDEHQEKQRLRGALRVHYHKNGKIIQPAIPPPPQGYFTPEEAQACQPIEHVLGEHEYFTPEDIRHHPSVKQLKKHHALLKSCAIFAALVRGANKIWGCRTFCRDRNCAHSNLALPTCSLCCGHCTRGAPRHFPGGQQLFGSYK